MHPVTGLYTRNVHVFEEHQFDHRYTYFTIVECHIYFHKVYNIYTFVYTFTYMRLTDSKLSTRTEGRI